MALGLAGTPLWAPLARLVEVRREPEVQHRSGRSVLARVALDLQMVLVAMAESGSGEAVEPRHWFWSALAGEFARYRELVAASVFRH